MTEKTFQLKVVSPKGLHVDAAVQAAVVPTYAGEIEVLPGHADLLGVIDAGVMSYKSAEGTKKAVVCGGIITVEAGVCTVICDSLDLPGAELNPEIEKSRIEASKIISAGKAGDASWEWARRAEKRAVACAALKL